MKRVFSIRKKDGVTILLLTVFIIISLVVSVVSTIQTVDEKNREYCFDDLAVAGKELANKLYENSTTDKKVLEAIATILSQKDELDEKDILNAMNAFSSENSYVTYLQALLPDNRLLNQDGTQKDVTGLLDFSEEARKGTYISSKMKSTQDSADYVVRNTVPVIKNGKTVCVLYGVISLKEFANLYTTDIYDGKAYVYVEDGDTGDFLLDTWHKKLGNVSDVSNRTMMPGYSFDKAIKDMQNGKDGNIAFVSKSIGQTLYMHYEPTKINNWNVAITVSEDAAFERTKSVSSILYKMSLAVGIIFLIYFIGILAILFSNYRIMKRLSTEDSITQVQNRNSFERYLAKTSCQTLPFAACIYWDVNGLHEVNNKYGHATGDRMLQIVANSIKSQFPYEEIYRIGGDEFVVLCTNETLESCQKKMEAIHALVEKHDYTVASGFAYCINEKGLHRIVREADADMGENKRKHYAAHRDRHPR